MASLLKSLHNIWSADATLIDLVPAEKVFTGRVPSDRLYTFPYVTILCTQGSVVYRSDKTATTLVSVSFHIWLDENDLNRGEQIAEAIEDAYCERCWSLEGGRTVLDCTDEGRGIEHQIELPTRKFWEVIKLVTLFVERTRVAHDDCCDQTV